MHTGELQYHIPRCCKRFADFTDYVNHNHHFSHLNQARSIRYNAVAIPVTSFEGDEQAVHMVRRTGCTRWRQNQPSSNDMVRLLVGNSPDSQFKSTTGGIPGLLKCLVIIDDAESNVDGLLAMVQMIATGPIRQTAGMVSVEESHQGPMQPLQHGSYH